MTLRAVIPDGWPPPRGYANGVVGRGDVLWVAGQIGWDRDRRFASTALVDQFATALDNVLAIVAAGGGGPRDIASMTVFVTDMAAYRAGTRALRDVWRARMGNHYPAMALVAVTELVEPAAVVEIQAVAVLEPPA